MKLYTLIALFGGAAAIKLHQSHSFLKVKDVELTDEQEDEIQAWVESELENGGTITKKEAKKALAAFAKKHGHKITKDEWAEANEAFNAVDTNGDGELNVDEVKAAVEAHGGSFLKVKEPELTEDQEAEIREWVTSELENGGTITKKEAKNALAAFAKKHGHKITKEEWAAANEVFEAVDTNDNGELDLAEVQAAVAAHAGSFIKIKDTGLTEEQEDEVQAWVESELENGGTITKKEAQKALAAFAKKHGHKITKEEWAEANAAFNAVDTDGNGELNVDEVKAAVAAHGGSFLKVKTPELTEDQEAEVREWVESELENGGTITKKEAKKALKAFAKKHGYKISKEEWAAANDIFNSVDTNADGELDLAEVQAAVAAHEGSFLKMKDTGLTEEQEDEVQAWVESELENGGTITKGEAKKALAAFAKKHGHKITKEEWAEANAAFNAVDTDGNGELNVDEVKAAVEAHGGAFLKVKEPELTADQEAEIEEWVTSELENGGTITKGEAKKALAAFAKKHGYKISKEEWAAANEIFDQVDTSGDGQLDLAEVQAAVAAHEGSFLKMRL